MPFRFDELFAERPNYVQLQPGDIGYQPQLPQTPVPPPMVQNYASPPPVAPPPSVAPMPRPNYSQRFHAILAGQNPYMAQQQMESMRVSRLNQLAQTDLQFDEAFQKTEPGSPLRKAVVSAKGRWFQGVGGTPWPQEVQQLYMQADERDTRALKATNELLFQMTGLDPMQASQKVWGDPASVAKYLNTYIEMRKLMTDMGLQEAKMQMYGSMAREAATLGGEGAALPSAPPQGIPPLPMPQGQEGMAPPPVAPGAGARAQVQVTPGVTTGPDLATLDREIAARDQYLKRFAGAALDQAGKGMLEQITAQRNSLIQRRNELTRQYERREDVVRRARERAEDIAMRRGERAQDIGLAQNKEIASELKDAYASLAKSNLPLPAKQLTRQMMADVQTLEEARMWAQQMASLPSETPELVQSIYGPQLWFKKDGKVLTQVPGLGWQETPLGPTPGQAPAPQAPQVAPPQVAPPVTQPPAPAVPQATVPAITAVPPATTPIPPRATERPTPPPLVPPSVPTPPLPELPRIPPHTFVTPAPQLPQPRVLAYKELTPFTQSVTIDSPVPPIPAPGTKEATEAQQRYYNAGSQMTAQHEVVSQLEARGEFGTRWETTIREQLARMTPAQRVAIGAGLVGGVALVTGVTAGASLVPMLAKIAASSAVGGGVGSLVDMATPFLNLIEDPMQRRYAAAKIGFIENQVRAVSGAAISPKEYTDSDAIYFPQVGDDSNVVSQKRRARETAIRAYQDTAGGRKFPRPTVESIPVRPPAQAPGSPPLPPMSPALQLRDRLLLRPTPTPSGPATAAPSVEPLQPPAPPPEYNRALRLRDRLLGRPSPANKYERARDLLMGIR